MLPRAPIEPEGTFDGLSASAILLGALVDLAATVIALQLLVLWLVPGAPPQNEAEVEKIAAQLSTSTSFIAANIALGALCTMLGAFVGARRAGQLHVRHGGWIAVTSQAIGVLLTLAQAPARSSAEFPLWAEALAWLLVLPAGMSGGALAAALPAAEKGQR